ncbi:MAG: hypothetical protein GW917_00540 [Bdellovibrionales bacterium]|nr:hypothetical protein [Bdellovibrionales bacterium]
MKCFTRKVAILNLILLLSSLNSPLGIAEEIPWLKKEGFSLRAENITDKFVQYQTGVSLREQSLDLAKTGGLSYPTTQDQIMSALSILKLRHEKTNCDSEYNLEKPAYEDLVGYVGENSPFGRSIPLVCIFSSYPVLDQLPIDGCTVSRSPIPRDIHRQLHFRKSDGKISKFIYKSYISDLYQYSCEDGEGGLLATNISSTELNSPAPDYEKKSAGRGERARRPFARLSVSFVTIEDGFLLVKMGRSQNLYFKAELF